MNSTTLSMVSSAIAERLNNPVVRRDGVTARLDDRWTLCIEAKPSAPVVLALVGQVAGRLEAVVEAAYRLADMRVLSDPPITVATIDDQLVLAVRLADADVDEPAHSVRAFERLRAIALQLQR